MAAKLLVANRHQTVIEFRLHPSFLFLIIALLSSCSLPPGKAANPAQTYQKIQSQFERGELTAARDSAKQAWSLSKDSEWGWKFKAQYALTLIYSSDLPTAENLLREPVPDRFPALRPRYQYLKGYLARRRKSPLAVPLLKSAYQLAVQQNDAVTQSEALVLIARDDAGNSDLQMLQKSLQIAQKNDLHYQQVASLTDIGMIMKEQQRFQEAIQYFSQAELVARTIQSDYLEYNVALNDIAGCYLNLGDLDRALQSLLRIRSQLRSTDPPTWRANVNMQLAEVYLLLQQPDEALNRFREAFAIIQTDPALDDYATSAERLAAALIETNQISEAEKLNELATENLARYPRKNPFDYAFNELNRGQIASQRKQFAVAEASYSKALQLLVNEPPNAIQWSAYAGLAEAKQQQGQNAEASKNFELALNSIEANRSQQTSPEHQITFLSALIRFYQRYVDFLVSQHQSDHALNVADSSRASVLSGLKLSRQDPGFLQKLRNAVAVSKAAVLFYWLGPEKSYLWAITPSGDEFHTLSSSTEIEAQVRSYSLAIQTARQDTSARQNPAGMNLYKILIGPAASRLKPGMPVVIVPDGALHGLNFETLLVKGDHESQPHYLIEDLRLTVAPSLRILLDKPKSAPASRKALLIGGAIYSNSDYSALPASKFEVQRLTALFPKASTLVYTEKEAVPNAYESAHPENFSIIHISAHVKDNPQSPLDSAIILSQGEYGRELYARDLMKKENHLNADLVTISGCNSVGKTVLKGEGMVGFAWAAFEAGAQNAVTSLWEADDRSTTELMSRFYTNITQGKPYAAALRNAKLEMLKGDFKKPYYWASFQLYSRNMGDNRTLVLQAKK